jgi:hypothetical protein
MKLISNKISLPAGCVALAVSMWASADIISDVAKIGANAGAMDYCENRIAKGSDKSKYKLLSISTYKEFDDLDSSDKLKALVYKKAAEDGDYLGDPLDEDRCDSLRKMLFIKYK